jgi:hypothetical protein
LSTSRTQLLTHGRSWRTEWAPRLCTRACYACEIVGTQSEARQSRANFPIAGPLFVPVTRRGASRLDAGPVVRTQRVPSLCQPPDSGTSPGAECAEVVPAGWLWQARELLVLTITRAPQFHCFGLGGTCAGNNSAGRGSHGCALLRAESANGRAGRPLTLSRIVAEAERYA